jgi:RHS repeat-associated protein
LYVSNEQPTLTDVYFDDVKMTHTSKIIQYNEYYPFGMQSAESYTKANSTNNFLYDQSGELNTTSGWYDLSFRNYDPALGRFHQVDPMATSFHNLTPYNYAGNNPVLNNDPNGDFLKMYSGPSSGPVLQSPPQLVYGSWNLDAGGGPIDIGDGGGGGSEDDDDDGGVYALFDDQGNIVGYRMTGSAAQDFIAGLQEAISDAGESGGDVVGDIINSIDFEPGGQLGYWVNQTTTDATSYNFIGTGDNVVNTSITANVSTKFVSLEGNNNSGTNGGVKAAMVFAATASVADGPLPIGDAVGIIGGAAILGMTYFSGNVGKGNANYPGPWVATKPSKADRFYNINSNYNFDPQNPKLPSGLVAGTIGGILDLIYDYQDRYNSYQPQMNNGIGPYLIQQDATKYFIPRTP